MPEFDTLIDDIISDRKFDLNGEEYKVDNCIAGSHDGIIRVILYTTLADGRKVQITIKTI